MGRSQETFNKKEVRNKKALAKLNHKLKLKDRVHKR